ncbi:hypothetical protein BJ742DRAFT_427246 [Cladochytrium replicatum]|nr:hypothetical protein BJ742DRAFT_427246 [Cladochytrium replicatum]
MSTVHRPVAPFERWNLQRHEDKIYGCVAWGVRYRPAVEITRGHISEKHQVELELVLLHACSQLLELHPRLSLGISSPRSKPMFVVLPTTTPSPLRVASDDVTLENLVNTQLDEFFDVEGQTEYLWRMVVSSDSRTGAINVVFAAHHVILDGLSGMQVLLDFVRILAVGSADELQKTAKVARTELNDDLPVEKRAPIVKPNLLLHLPTIIAELLFPKLAAKFAPRMWSPLHETAKYDLTPSARTRPRPFNALQTSAELLRVVRAPETAPKTRTIAFTIPKKARLLQLARRNKTTLHCALLTATQDAIASAFSLDPKAMIGSLTPSSLRADCVPPASQRPYTLGVFVAGVDIADHPNVPISSTESTNREAYREVFWDDARRKKELLRKARPYMSQRTGLLSWLPEDAWASHFLNELKLEQPQEAYQISNLLEWDFPETLSVSTLERPLEFVFEDLVWSQPLNFVGPIFSLHVASCGHSDVLYSTISFRMMAGVRIQEIEEVKRYILDCLDFVCSDEKQPVFDQKL